MAQWANSKSPKIWMDCRRNGELTQVEKRNDCAAKATSSKSQLVTRMGQLTDRSSNYHCWIWIPGKAEVAGFGFVIQAEANVFVAATLFRM